MPDARPRVLIIDDNPDDRAVYRRYLAADYDISEAALGEEGLLLGRQQPPDCLILDYNLPHMNGLQVLKAWVEDPGPHVAALVFLTGVGQTTLAVQAMQHGAHDYLEKAPLTAEVLRHTLRRAREMARLQGELERSREWSEVTLAAIGDAVIATDTASRVMYMNPCATLLTGWPAAEACGRGLSEVFRIGREGQAGAADDPVQRVLQAGQVVGLAYHTLLYPRQGEAIPINSNAAPIRDRRGVLRGVVLVFRDVSVQRRAEEELLRAQKIESVGVLAGGIAHDFNNLLTGILGNISLVQRSLEPQHPVMPRLVEAARACQRATALTQQLLTFARGGAPVRHPEVISDLLREVALFALHGSSVRPVLQLPEDLWAVQVDAGQIQQVIHNVVLNAAQAMPTGGTLTLQAANVETPLADAPTLPVGRYVCVTVQDQGRGIPPEVLPKIFDPYFTTREAGQGLGLATAYAILSKHEGAITVESSPPLGTTVRIYLPAAPQAPAPRLEPPVSPPSAGNGHILVMDDEELIGNMLSAMLTHLGYTATCVRDGAAAVQAYAQAQAAGQPFAAVILDLTIPGGMGGRETLARLRASDPQVKALVSSGYTHDDVLADVVRYGFQGAVNKPYTLGQLRDTLQRLLAEPASPASEASVPTTAHD
ncbi:MAG: response regulator [Candidatus Tectimicrobiota bacterium]